MQKQELCDLAWLRRAYAPIGCKACAEQVLRAVARSKVSGWFASSNISLAVAEAPLRRSLWLWGGGIAVAAGLTIALAWLFERSMSRPMRFASRAAGALSRGGVVAP